MDIDLTDMASLLGAGRSFSPTSPARKRARGASEADGAAASPPLHPMCPVLEAGATAELLTQRVMVTASEAAAIEAYEQGSEAWLLSRRGTQTRLKDGSFWSDRELERRAAMGSDEAAAAAEPPLRFLPGRLTASNFGTAVGHNKYTSADALVEDMLWGVVVSNEAMRYGSETEPVACDIFETALFFLTGGHVRVEHRGLMLACPGLEIKAGGGGERSEPRYEGWCGTSPDGIVHYSGPYARPPSLLEIKCPSGNRRLFYSDRAGHDRYGIPHYYFDQIQGIMGLQHLADALFVVHLPDRTQVARYVFQPAYFDELARGLRAFWFERYLPAAVACARGRLRRGAIKPEPGMEAAAAEAAEAAAAAEAVEAAAAAQPNVAQPATVLLLDDDPEAEARTWLEADARPPAGMDILLRETAGGGDEQEDGELESE
jgi:hypothetical protein